VPLVNVQAIEAALESIAQRDPSARGGDPHRFYDDSIVDELQRSGFIDALYPAHRAAASLHVVPAGLSTAPRHRSGC
jgi:hypothetical protein